MSTDDNKALLRRYLAQAWGNDGSPCPLELFSPGYRRHPAPGASPLTRGQQKNLVAGFRSALPDAAIAVEDLMARRFTLRGTQLGARRDIPPMVRPVTAAGLDVVRIENGQIAEHSGSTTISFGG